MEAHRDGLAVQIAAVMQDMRLEIDRIPRRNGGACADIGHGGVNPPVDLRRGVIHAVRRRDAAVGKTLVDRRHAERAPELLAVQYLAAQIIPIAEQDIRRLHVARRQQGADAGGADRCAAKLHAGRHAASDPRRGAERAQAIGIACGFRAEAIIIAGKDGNSAELVQQDLRDKRLGRERTQLVKVADDREVHAECAELTEAVVKRQNAARAVRRCGKNKHRGVCPQHGALFFCGGNDRAVPDMHAVKGAERDDKPPGAAHAGCKMYKIHGLFNPEIVFDKGIEQLVPVDPANQAARAVIVGDIGRVLREDVAHDLVDGVIPLFAERVVDFGQRCLHSVVFNVNLLEDLCLLFLVHHHTAPAFPGDSSLKNSP